MAPIPPAERAAAAIAYFTFVPAVVLLLLPGHRSHRFVRFHAWQSVLLWAVFLVLFGAALFLSNLASAVVVLLFAILISLAMLFLWIVLSLKAWEGERFELPLFGDLAMRLK
jgi:uncharacterized membrane protein